MTPRIKNIAIILAAALILSAAAYQIYLRLPSSSAGNRKIIKYEVPFTTQSPFAKWSDSRQQDGCEEASALMAFSWAKGIKTIVPAQAEKEIIAASDWELKNYGNFRDTSADDTANRIIKGYFNYSNLSVKRNISAGDIIKALEAGKLVIIPANGRVLGNPYFTSPGPERHMLVITGYDYAKNEFITNDPGTRYGKDYRYGKDLLFNAIRDYPSDNGVTQAPITGNEKNIIIVSK